MVDKKLYMLDKLPCTEGKIAQNWQIIPLKPISLLMSSIWSLVSPTCIYKSSSIKKHRTRYEIFI